MTPSSAHRPTQPGMSLASSSRRPWWYRSALALEGTGGGSPYQAGHYERWHGLLRGVLERIPEPADGDFTAHALLAAVEPTSSNIW